MGVVELLGIVYLLKYLVVLVIYLYVSFFELLYLIKLGGVMLIMLFRVRKYGKVWFVIVVGVVVWVVVVIMFSWLRVRVWFDEGCICGVFCRVSVGRLIYVLLCMCEVVGWGVFILNRFDCCWVMRIFRFLFERYFVSFCFVFF